MGDKSEQIDGDPYLGVAQQAPTAQESTKTKLQRPLSLYDVVAGKAGPNGFLTEEEAQSQNILSLAPEEVLLRKTTIPAEYILDSYDAVGKLPNGVRLPDSEMLKAMHAYASDFYNNATPDEGAYDFRSLDETALIAMGILLEEAVRGALGENGDMVFVEPEGLDQGPGESKMTRYQVQGKVKPKTRLEDASDQESVQDDDEELPAKRRRHR
ncbi:hypothetical protein A1O1_01562 [Capronia coronata CBS 617.96]|uniref:Uncharacterized protein n=1 Tax=Capronia coronata CBS 617.96 TaxID=1182541 RepID=W9Z4C6_9EURO|nr:uncharacterized protein A1O1_01562 [Capronia coronata CBS 617.96]EXJ96436.1 hypothetical protein A1O1_01562 [Capronia coronata CBS 617.96]